MLSKNSGFVFFAVSAIMLLASCASNTNFYSAKPLGRGNLQGFAAVSTIKTAAPADTQTAALIRPDFTIFEVGAMIGVTDKIDVGIKYSFPLAGFLEAKYNLLSTDKKSGFYFSPGLRAGYTALPTDSGAEEDNQRIELAVPLYASFYPAEWFGLTIIPTYSLRFFVPAEGDFFEHLLGGNVNVRIGKKFGGVIECAVHRNFTWEWTEIQVGGGMFLTFRNLF
jgi:hypothetical protein